MTANRKRGEVQLEIGGEVRTLKLNFNAIAALEEMHDGTPVTLLLERGRMGIKVVRNALFVAIVNGEPRKARIQKLTPEMVGDWLSAELDRFEEFVQVLMEVVTAAMPGGGEADPTKPAADATPPADPKAEVAKPASTSTTSDS